MYLRQSGIDVRVIVTENALRFTSLDMLEAFSGQKVFTSIFDRGDGVTVPHVELTSWADIFVVMPGSADMLARVATGRADDLLSAAVLNSEIPVLVVPALNDTLVRKVAVRRNIEVLRADGVHVMEPVPGRAMRVSTVTEQGSTLPSLEDVVERARNIVAANRRSRVAANKSTAGLGDSEGQFVRGSRPR
jgi:phosphopantothenoylcysteine decarboxylase/phosphopantothenate--cysteine ligase